MWVSYTAVIRQDVSHASDQCLYRLWWSGRGYAGEIAWVIYDVRVLSPGFQKQVAHQSYANRLNHAFLVRTMYIFV